MDNATLNSRLNDLLVEIHRSLTQYVVEAWTWSAGQSEGLQSAVRQVAAAQERDVQRLVNLLAARGARIDYGVYPHEYTSLHYVAIEYLARQLLDSQRGLVQLLEAAEGEFADTPAADAVREIAANQRDGLRALDEAWAGQSAPPVAWMK